MNDNSKNLFFLIISFVCFWLVLDQYFGKKLIGDFVGGIGGTSSGGTANTLPSDGSSNAVLDEQLGINNDMNFTGITSKGLEKLKAILKSEQLLGTGDRKDIIRNKYLYELEQSKEFDEREKNIMLGYLKKKWGIVEK